MIRLKNESLLLDASVCFNSCLPTDNSLNIKIAMAEHFYLLQRIIFFYLNKIFYQNPTSLDTLCIGEIN